MQRRCYCLNCLPESAPWLGVGVGVGYTVGEGITASLEVVVGEGVTAAGKDKLANKGTDVIWGNASDCNGGDIARLGFAVGDGDGAEVLVGGLGADDATGDAATGDACEVVVGDLI